MKIAPILISLGRQKGLLWRNRKKIKIYLRSNIFIILIQTSETSNIQEDSAEEILLISEQNTIFPLYIYLLAERRNKYTN